jgi:hypothetical protein
VTGRNWSGAGTFTLQDLTVSDTATTVQTAWSSVLGSAPNVWTLNSGCSGYTPRPSGTVGSPAIY